MRFAYDTQEIHPLIIRGIALGYLYGDMVNNSDEFMRIICGEYRGRIDYYARNIIDNMHEDMYDDIARIIIPNIDVVSDNWNEAKCDEFLEAIASVMYSKPFRNAFADTIRSAYLRILQMNSFDMQIESS